MSAAAPLPRPALLGDPEADVRDNGAALRRALGRVNRRLRAGELPELPVRGQLIRPRLARAVAAQPGAPSPTARFWYGAAAVQMAHEASLVHDDIIDGAAERRGEPTLVARHGLGAALAHGDHLLTTAYRLAARTRSGAFVDLFARAVEQTVAGEIRQGRATGAALALQEYRAIVAAKSGALLGAAWAVGPAVAGSRRLADHEAAGRRLGVVYQMLDDLLDYCPGTASGKPALADHRGGRWTWPLALLQDRAALQAPVDAVLDALHRRTPGGPSTLERGVALLEAEADAVLAAAGELLEDARGVAALLTAWTRKAAAAAALEAERRQRGGQRPPRVVPRSTVPRVAVHAVAAGDGARAAAAWVEGRLAAAADGSASMARHARSFRFAAALFPPAERRRVEALYAFCRFTDDLVDAGDAPGRELEARLDAWLALARRAHEGRGTGHALLDLPMEDAAAAGVPFRLAEELVEGMRMDARGLRYATAAELRVYTYRVAGVVGEWMTRLFGVHDPAVLAHAAALGHAMQLTNILRDVGEDLLRERLYLPADLLAAHGVTEAALRGALAGGPLPRGYAAVLEGLMRVADDDYRRAFAAIPALPPYARRPVAVAARVYQGIHGAIRRNDHDNLRHRAHTGGLRKVLLAAGALRDLGGGGTAAERMGRRASAVS